MEVREKTGYQQNQGKKFQISEIFLHRIDRYKVVGMYTVWLCGELLLLGSIFVINWCCCVHYPNGKWRPHLKEINMCVFCLKYLGKLKKKIRGKSGKIHEI